MQRGSRTRDCSLRLSSAPVKAKETTGETLEDRERQRTTRDTSMCQRNRALQYSDVILIHSVNAAAEIRALLPTPATTSEHMRKTVSSLDSQRGTQTYTCRHRMNELYLLKCFAIARYECCHRIYEFPQVAVRRKNDANVAGGTRRRRRRRSCRLSAWTAARTNRSSVERRWGRRARNGDRLRRSWRCK